MEYKEQLIFLIREYNNKKYTTKDFCDQFTLIYNHYYKECTHDIKDKNLFLAINSLAERYSPYHEDIENCNDFFIDEETFINRYFNVIKEYVI